MKVLWIGWCNDPVENHDKVWGIGLSSVNPKATEEVQRWGWTGLPHTYMTFWGRRGKKLQRNKKEMTEHEARKLIESKSRKGYDAVPSDKVNEVYERFEKDLFMISLRG